jgi:hypothetical protein
MVYEKRSSQTILRTRPSLKAAAMRAAAEEHRSLSSLIEKLLTDYLRARRDLLLRDDREGAS